MDVLDRVRASCQAVAERSRFVAIDHQRLDQYAQSLPLGGAPAALDPAHHILDPPETALAFIVTLDTINFGSGYFPCLRKRPGLSGYFTVASSLADQVRAHGAFDATALTLLTTSDCATLCGQTLDNGSVAELMGLFAQALQGLGHFLIDRYDGRFAGPIEAAEHSAARLVPILATMPFFLDSESYEELEVSFYKRAQLMAADLALTFNGDGWGRFDDLSRLTIFADNLVPHVLRVDGVLRYDADLAARIDASELIAAGSPEEIEIRANAVHAVELLTHTLRAQNREMTAMDLDYLLWNRGQSPHYKARPRHRTRTVFY